MSPGKQQGSDFDKRVGEATVGPQRDILNVTNRLSQLTVSSYTGSAGRPTLWELWELGLVTLLHVEVDYFTDGTRTTVWEVGISTLRHFCLHSHAEKEKVGSLSHLEDGC